MTQRSDLPAVLQVTLPAQRQQARRLPTLIGLLLAVGGPLLYDLIAPLVLQPLVPAWLYSLSGISFDWLLVLSLAVLLLVWERQPATALGLRPLGWKLLVLALGLGVLLGAAEPLLAAVGNSLLPGTSGGTESSLAAGTSPWLLLVGIITAAITEEVIYRGYLLERLASLTGTPWLAALLSLGAFTAVHLGGWNAAHVIFVVIPIGAALTGLYLWRHNVILTSIVHVVFDLPLFFIALGFLR